MFVRYIKFWQLFLDKLVLISMLWPVLILKSPYISVDVTEFNKSLTSLNLRKGPSLNFYQTGYDKIKVRCFEYRFDYFFFPKFCCLAFYKR